MNRKDLPMRFRSFTLRIFSRGFLIVVVSMLFVAICALTAQQYQSLKMSSVMTNDEFVESGIGSLTPPQRAVLDRWLNRYTAHVFEVASKAPSTTIGLVHSGCTPALETTIDGEFQGWDGETIFKLSNGQIWQQAEYSYTYSYAYMPEVTIYATDSGCKLKVEDEDETILVKRIK
jgi:hypothetical protein